jgi:autotransporter adhesin
VDGSTGTVTGLTNKTWAAGQTPVSGRAATEDQLASVSATANKGWNVTTSKTGTGVVNGSSTTNVAPGDTVTYTAGNNIEVTQYGKEVQIATSMTPTFNKTTIGSVITNGTNNTIAGLSNTTFTPGATYTGGQAATQEQVGQAYTAAVDKGFGLKAQDGSTVMKKLGETVDVVGGSTASASSANTKTVVNNGKIEVQIVDAPTFAGTVTAPKFTTSGANSISVDGSTGTVTGLTNKTWAAGQTPVSGRAATEDQLASVSDAATKAKTTVTQGKNVVVTQTTNADGSTNYQVATAKDVTFDSATVGTVKIDKANVDTAGNTIISGVGAGAVSATSTDAINGSQLYGLGTGVQNIIGGKTTYDPATGTYVNNNIGDTGKGNINDAIASVKDAATKAKTTVTQGKNVVVTQTTNADGSTNYQVATAKDVTFDSATVGTVKIDKANVDTAGNTIISGVGAGAVSATSTDAINGSQLYTTNQQVTQNTTDISSINTTLEKGLNFSADSGATVNRKLGDTVVITGDGNIISKTTSDGVQVGLSNNLNLKNVTVNQNFSVAEGATVNMGGNVIQNVGAGVANTDAVNVGQLKNVVNHVNKVENKLSGGIAASAALAVVTPVEPGTYHLSGGTAYYNGGYGIGFNLLKRSDNGRTTLHAGVGWGSGGGGALVRVGAGFSFGGN